MSTHKTSDGRWFVAYYPPGQDRTKAKRKYFGRGPEAKLAAESWDVAFKRAKRDSPAQAMAVESEAADLTFLEVAQRYLDQHPLSETSKYCIKLSLNRHAIPLWGHVPVNTLSMRHLADLDAAMVKAGLSLSTRNRYRSYCRAICQWAVNNDLAKENPFARFRPDRKREGKAPDLITEAELRSIWESAPDHLRWAIVCMLNLGVRPGKAELFAIRIADVDFERRGVWVTRTKTNSPKTMIPVQDGFLAAVNALINADHRRVYLVEYPDNPGQPVGSLKTSWWATLRRAGITRRIRLYDLRHLYASLFFQGGADVKAVSELLGHASPAMTLGVYYHLLDRQKSEAVDRLKLPDLAGKDHT